MLKKKNIKYINFNENNDINEVLNYANKNNIKYFFLFGIGHNSVLAYKMGAFLNNIKLYAF